MNKNLEQLIELSKLNQQIDDIGPQIKAHEHKLEKKLSQIDGIKLDFEKTKQTIVDTQASVKTNNTHLKELSKKLKEIVKKTNKLKTQKEVNAVQVEEDIARQSISFTNDEIERLQNIVQLKKTQNKERQENLKIEKKLHDDMAKTVKQEIKDLNTKIEEISKVKGTLSQKVDTKLLSFYESIENWAKETAVVIVKNRACYGCFMKLSNKTYSMLKLENEVVNCDNCGRIIYIDDEKKLD